MSQPVRTCVGCRVRANAEDLVRLAWDSATERVVFDTRRRLPGRGAWVHPKGNCLALAITRRAFVRALRRPVTEESVAQLVTGGGAGPR